MIQVQQDALKTSQKNWHCTYNTASKEPKLSSQDCRSLVRELQRSPTINVKELAALGRYEVALTPNTIRRTVEKHNYEWKKMQAKPMLTDKHKADRLLFAKKYLHFTIND